MQWLQGYDAIADAKWYLAGEDEVTLRNRAR